MALEISGELQDRIVGQPLRTAAAEQSAGGQHACHDRRGRRAEAEPLRNRVHAAQPDPWRLLAEHLERGPHRPDHQVAFAVSRGPLADADDLDPQPATGDLRVYLVVQAECQAKRVESGAKVGARRRRLDHGRAARPPH